MPEMEARPPAENRHGGAPRGERPASWDAPRLTSADPSRLANATNEIVRLSALRPPLSLGFLGDGRDHEDKTRAHQRAAGTKNTALFDIVNMTTANGSLRAPRLRTRRARAPLSCPGRASVSERRPGTQGRHGKIDVHVAPGSRVSLRSPGTRTHCAISRDGVTLPIAGAARPLQRKPTKPPAAS